jgi:hypothetical protein
MMGERISPDELAFHRPVVAGYERALAVMDAWMAHLAVRYGLRSGVDHVEPDGAIVRGEIPLPGGEGA